MRFHFVWKSHFGVQSALYLCSYELRWNETKNGMDFISVILTQMKFQTSMRFLREQDLPETKWISIDSLDIVFNANVRLKLIAGMDFISVILTNKISFCVIKYHVNTTQNEMPTHVHQNIRSFWYAAKLRRHVNRTCFHAGLESQTGMSSFCLSCERTLSQNVDKIVVLFLETKGKVAQVSFYDCLFPFFHPYLSTVFLQEF